MARGEVVAASRRHDARLQGILGDIARGRAEQRDAEVASEERLREANQRLAEVEGKAREQVNRLAELDSQCRGQAAKLERLKQVTSIIRNVTKDVGDE